MPIPTLAPVNVTGVCEPEWIDAPRRERVAMRGSDPRVPYGELERAIDRAEARFPQATKFVALWAPNGEHEVLVEVWHGDRAQVVSA